MIPSRDRWPWLRTAIASSLAQRDVDVSVVVVDDGSVDRTPGELRAARHEHVRVIRHERPEGVSAARNRGLSHVTAPWVAFLDDDDVWAPGHLSAMLDAVRGSELDPERVGLVYSGHINVDGNRHVTHISPAGPTESVRERLQLMNPVGGPSRVVLRTDAVRAVGGFDERFSTLADWDLWLRVVAEYEVVRCPELLVAYMSHDGNMTLAADQFLADLARLAEKHGWAHGKHRDAELSGHVATIYRRAGRRFAAARWYARSFRLGHSPRDLGRAVGVLLGERIVARSGLRLRPRVDPSLGWWLEGLREAERATISSAPAPSVHDDLTAL